MQKCNPEFSKVSRTVESAVMMFLILQGNVIHYSINWPSVICPLISVCYVTSRSPEEGLSNTSARPTIGGNHHFYSYFKDILNISNVFLLLNQILYMLIWLFLIVIIIIALNCHYNTLPMLHCHHCGGEVNSQQMKIGGYIVWIRGRGKGQRGGVTVFDRWWRRLPGSTCRWGWLIWAGSDPGPRRPGSRLGGNHLSAAGCSDPDWFAGEGRISRGGWSVFSNPRAMADH